MSEKDCRYWLNFFSDYLDKELEVAVCRELEAHLKRCPHCQVVVDTLRQTLYLYQTILREQTPTLPPEVQQRLYARISLEALRQRLQARG
ncbi:MAG TPA: hypothetical protein G4O04_02115 [Anaerolineae bacterium]|nr:hypothetical protein [Anaerolineae bacterium]HID84039.1 hypothetical protein [Anaerolineales bacterium]HIQ08028.1 hypothetical protein [Anaerolineaceae bacterium]